MLRLVFNYIVGAYKLVSDVLVFMVLHMATKRFKSKRKTLEQLVDRKGIDKVIFGILFSSLLLN